MSGVEAPLKRDVFERSISQENLFPRSRERGPIEALSTSALAVILPHGTDSGNS